MRMMSIAALAGLILSAPAAMAQIADSDQPIQVTATKQAVWSRTDATYTYEENVKVVQGGSQLTSDKLVVYCNKTAVQNAKGKPDEQQSCDPIGRIIADGNILYTTPNESIRGDRAEYDYPTDTITVTGKVTMSSGKQGLVRATKVVYEVSKGMVTITSDADKPVFSVFTPDRKPAAPGATPAPSAAPAAPAKPN